MEETVKDSFDVKGRVAVDYGAVGVVVIFEAESRGDPPVEGTAVLIVRPDGWMVRARMGEVKEHGPGGFGAFFINLSKQAVPVGSRLRWGDDFWPKQRDVEFKPAAATSVS